MRRLKSSPGARSGRIDRWHFIPAFALAFMLMGVTAPAMAGESDSPADCRIGPWQLGMTREQVASIADSGPYRTDTSDANAEYANALLDGHEAHVRLAFENNKLASVEASKYEGSDLSAAKIAALEVFDLFTAKLGGAQLPPMKLNDQAAFNRAGMAVFVDQMLGRSPKAFEDMDADAKKKGKKGIVATFVFDMVPVNQPPDCRLHSQLFYSSARGQYGVHLFEDLPGSKSRQVKANIHIDYAK